MLDIHAHTALTGLFIYGNSYDDVYRYERHIVFPKILAQNCDDFNSNNTIYNADQKKSGSVRRHMTSYLSHEVNTYTLEVSLLGYEDKDRRQIVPYTDDLYAKIGRNVTRAFWDYYKIVGTIPLEDSSDEEPASLEARGERTSSEAPSSAAARVLQDRCHCAVPVNCWAWKAPPGGP